MVTIIMVIRKEIVNPRPPTIIITVYQIGQPKKKEKGLALASVAQLVGESSPKPRGCEFDCRSQDMARLQVRCSWGAYGRLLMDVSLTLMFLSLPSSHSEINKYVPE